MTYDDHLNREISRATDGEAPPPEPTRQTVAVNGQTPVWAVLEDGDRLEINGDAFRVRLPAALESSGV